MSYEVVVTPEFKRQAKGLSKRHRSFKEDLKEFVDSLKSNPFQGDELKPNIRKIRMAISSKGKGKSGGARVITYTLVYSSDGGRIYLMNVYDKSDYSTVDVSIIEKIVKELE